jgi:hypothetical protein
MVGMLQGVMPLNDPMCRALASRKKFVLVISIKIDCSNRSA